ncbi:hypothetical protein HK103_004068 [Boothiomyces macroporosus]|uniref:Uncharacterized protein n=1 Tax=Boothiomyces macroporosus TaxID=261099 RepID=A0AAD5Y8M8_9FUNG|nr:hypothetical protein HK103_004068 [Boothiomyces macroporosus]
MNIDLGYDYEIAELDEINKQSKLVSVDLKILPRKPVLVTNLELTLNPIVDSLIRIYEYKQYYIVNYKYDPKDVFNVSKYITEISSKTVVLQVDGSSPDNNDGIQVFKSKGALLLSIDDELLFHKEPQDCPERTGF